MPTIGSITKTIRINPRDLEVIEGLMEDGTTWSGAIHKLCEGVPSIKPEEVEIPKYVSEMGTIGRAYGLSGEEIIKKLIEAMEEGLITYENGTFRAYSEEEYDMSRFKEACMDKGVPIQKMLDKAAQMVWSS